MTRFDKIGLAQILLGVCLWTVLGLALPARSQDKALERSFTAGDSARYRIQLSVRSEVQGQQTETIGAKAYVRPFARAATGTGAPPNAAVPPSPSSTRQRFIDGDPTNAATNVFTGWSNSSRANRVWS